MRLAIRYKLVSSWKPSFSQAKAKAFRSIWEISRGMSIHHVLSSAQRPCCRPSSSLIKVQRWLRKPWPCSKKCAEAFIQLSPSHVGYMLQLQPVSFAALPTLCSSMATITHAKLQPARDNSGRRIATFGFTEVRKSAAPNIRTVGFLVS